MPDRRFVLRAALGAALLGALAVAWRVSSAAKLEEARASCAKAERSGCESACERGAIDECATLGELARDSAPERAREAYRVACTNNRQQACRQLGRLLELGRGGAPDPSGAAKAYQSACDAKDEEACGRLGLLLRAGTGIPRDDARAGELLERGCNAGVGEACAALADMAEKGEGIEKNPKHAALLYSRGCNANEPTACLWLAQHDAPPTEEHEETVFGAGRYFERACVLGAAPGCADALYASADATSKIDSAFLGDLAKRACDANDARGCEKVGDYALHDAVLPLDYDVALKALTKACDADAHRGCLSLANVYADGLGVPKDPARAEQLARKACGDKAALVGTRWRCPTPPNMHEGGTSLSGRVTIDLMMRALSMASSQYPSCWQTRGLTSVKGKVTVSLSIDPSGLVTAASAVSNEGLDPITAACVVDVVRELRFPPPEFGLKTRLVVPISIDSGGP